MMDEYPEELEKTRYYYMMDDFDGSTGFNLFGNLNQYDTEKLYNDACHTLHLSDTAKKGKKTNGKRK